MYPKPALSPVVEQVAQSHHQFHDGGVEAGMHINMLVVLDGGNHLFTASDLFLAPSAAAATTTRQAIEAMT
jgi:hypothetical protein